MTEIEESDAIVSKLFSCKFKIDGLLAVIASASVTSPSPAVVAPAENYGTALELLKQRFGKKQQIITALSQVIRQIIRQR